MRPMRHYSRCWKCHFVSIAEALCVMGPNFCSFLHLRYLMKEQFAVVRNQMHLRNLADQDRSLYGVNHSSKQRDKRTDDLHRRGAGSDSDLQGLLGWTRGIGAAAVNRLRTRSESLFLAGPAANIRESDAVFCMRSCLFREVKTSRWGSRAFRAAPR